MEYIEGVYSSPLTLGENELEVEVTVKDNKVNHVCLLYTSRCV